MAKKKAKARKAPARKAKSGGAGIAKQKITPFLWYEGKAEEAARFYVSLFKNSKVNSVNPMTVSFTLAGQDFIALNGGPMFKFNESFSMFVDCKDQKEIDYLWSALTAHGGQESQCGWLKDKFGLSWQIIPTQLPHLVMTNPRAMEAMLKMQKIDIATLESA
jgi:predicted 3-demethylubiquinone-9 3-methyltransferase (glyoxalase superfamily)